MAVDLKDLHRCYRQTFGSPTGAVVLKNLMPALFADESTFDPDQRTHAYNEGKRAVWLHINKFLAYTPEQVARIYAGLPLVLTTDEVENGMA